MTSLTKKPKKYVAIFTVMALLGTNLEIGSRWMSGDLIGFRGLSAPSLAGWSSLWMLGIYGFVGVVLGGMNETTIGEWRMISQCLLALVFSLAVEFSSGCVLNLWLKLEIWDYRNDRFNLYGQICAANAVKFFFLSPFAFWADDLIRHLAYGEKRPPSLGTYYGRLFTLR